MMNEAIKATIMADGIKESKGVTSKNEKESKKAITLPIHVVELRLTSKLIDYRQLFIST